MAETFHFLYSHPKLFCKRRKRKLPALLDNSNQAHSNAAADRPPPPSLTAFLPVGRALPISPRRALPVYPGTIKKEIHGMLTLQSYIDYTLKVKTKDIKLGNCK